MVTTSHSGPYNRHLAHHLQLLGENYVSLLSHINENMRIICLRLNLMKISDTCQATAVVKVLASEPLNMKLQDVLGETHL
jgi:hypothetical protein